MVTEEGPERDGFEGRLERFNAWLGQLQEAHNELSQRLALGGHNANRLQDRRISRAAPSAGALVVWNATTKKYEPQAPATAVAHNILSATHGDSLAAAVVDGDVVIGNATPAWSRLAVSVPAANVRNVLGVDNGELRPSWKAMLDGTNPVTQAHSDSPSPGTSLIAAHRDHRHGMPAGGGGAVDSIEDADADTQIQAEESADEDVIRFDTAGFERVVIDATGHITFGGASRQFLLKPGLVALGANNYDGISLQPSSVNPTGNTRTLRGFNAQMTVNADGGSSGHKILGMRFLGGLGGGVLALNETVTASEVTACSLEPAAVLVNFSGTKTVDITTMRGLWILPALSYIFEPSAAGTIATYRGIDVDPPASDATHITDYTGIHVGDTADPTGNIYLLNVGPSTPYFRVLGNFTAAANRTPVYISEGATPTLRQLRTIDPGAGGVNFVGGELVCELV